MSNDVNLTEVLSVSLQRPAGIVFSLDFSGPYRCYISLFFTLNNMAGDITLRIGALDNKIKIVLLEHCPDAPRLRSQLGIWTRDHHPPMFINVVNNY